MEFNGMSDSSGTDDDLPPIHRNRYQRDPRSAGNMRAAIVRPPPVPAMHGDMESQIHTIEQDAYCAIIRAFRAQSDAISWEKESLITELRKELRVSDEENRELLARVNSDETIRRIREWRKSNGIQPNFLSTSQPPHHDLIPSPTVSASHKKRKTSQTAAPLPMVAPPHPAIQPSRGSILRPPPSAARIKKPKSSMQHPSAGPTGRPQGGNRGPESTSYDPLIGKKVWTRWPDDNSFYEAVITDYNPAEGRHALVYDINTVDETWEWVNLKEISPNDIRWEGEDPGASRKGTGRGINKKPIALSGSATTAIGRGRGAMKGGVKKDGPLSQNGIGRKKRGDIRILHTETLIKEVEKVIGSNQPNAAEIEKAKNVLKEHEQALLDAIARLEDASDGESEG